MNAALESCFGKVVEEVVKDGRCEGAWHYGSVGRGMSDECSDYDPVFLVGDAHFEAFSSDVVKFLSPACDEVVLSWPENYNGPVFKNFCNLVRLGEDIRQLDFFVLNADHVDDWWCRQHLKDCTRDNLVFDRSGKTAALLDRGLRTDDGKPDARRCVDTWWFHAQMLVKYFKREDLFKLAKNIDILFHAHVDLLLSLYDNTRWGGWESKVKHCVPEEGQAKLLGYFVPAGLASWREMVLARMEDFDGDARAVCAAKGIGYPERLSRMVQDHFTRETGTVNFIRQT